MVRYMKCPRCELNYIDAEKQDYCDVCLKEMKGISLDVDELEETEVPTELCPVCGENMMRPGEKMCDECKQKAEYEEEEPDPDEDDEWREYLDDETDSEIDEEIGEDFVGEFDEEDDLDEEDEEYVSEDEEDMEYVTGDEIYSIADDDDDDDDDKDSDEDF